MTHGANPDELEGLGSTLEAPDRDRQQDHQGRRFAAQLDRLDRSGQGRVQDRVGHQLQGSAREAERGVRRGRQGLQGPRRRRSGGARHGCVTGGDRLSTAAAVVCRCGQFVPAHRALRRRRLRRRRHPVEERGLVPGRRGALRRTRRPLRAGGHRRPRRVARHRTPRHRQPGIRRQGVHPLDGARGHRHDRGSGADRRDPPTRRDRGGNARRAGPPPPARSRRPRSRRPSNPARPDHEGRPRAPDAQGHHLGARTPFQRHRDRAREGRRGLHEVARPVRRRAGTLLHGRQFGPQRRASR